MDNFGEVARDGLDLRSCIQRKYSSGNYSWQDFWPSLRAPKRYLSSSFAQLRPSDTFPNAYRLLTCSRVDNWLEAAGFLLKAVRWWHSDVKEL
jgi:hypothetical protein